MYRVGYVAGARADYGIVRRYLSLLQQEPDIQVSLLLTGALLEPRFGDALSVIEQDGFPVDLRLSIEVSTKSPAGTIRSMALALDGFGKFFEEHRYDLVIILGDRYEVFSAATAAAMQRIRILHLHGGEATYANYDEFIRHSITKMSCYHITSAEAYRRRVVQLGEDPGRVFCCGALGAENCLEINMLHVPLSVRQLPFKKTLTILFHPETLSENRPCKQFSEVLLAIGEFLSRYRVVFIGSNADTHADEIMEMLRDFCEQHPEAQCFVNLHPDAYHFLVKQSLALVGNSSSGLIEAPSLGTQTVNIGHRQDGRIRGNSVMDVPCKAERICEAIRLAEEREGMEIANPYFQEHASERYLEVTRQVLRKHDDVRKQFYDLQEGGRS